MPFNADTIEAAKEVKKTLPQLRGGQVIITSRIADLGGAISLFELDVLFQEDAAAFLLERTETRRTNTPTDIDDAVAQAHDVERHEMNLGRDCGPSGVRARKTREHGWSCRRLRPLWCRTPLFLDPVS